MMASTPMPKRDRRLTLDPDPIALELPHWGMHFTPSYPYLVVG